MPHPLCRRSRPGPWLHVVDSGLMQEISRGGGGGRLRRGKRDMTHGKGWWLLWVLVLLPATAWADPPAQASMVVHGTIEIAPDGSVTGYQLEHASRIPPGVSAQMAKVVPHWRFEPVRVDGRPVAARSGMWVRLVAKPVDEHHVAISIDSTWFMSDHAVNTTDVLQRDHMRPPPYPPAAVRSRVQGTAYVVVRITPRGKVDKIATRQVDLRTRGTRRQLRQWRKMFADASERAIRHWTFTPPTTGPRAGQDHWVAVIPVRYQLNPSRKGGRD